MAQEKKKKLCVVVASRANYGRIKTVLQAAQAHPDIELQVIAGASTMLERYGRAVDILRKDGFEPDAMIYYVIEGENLATQAKTTGLGIIELTTAYEHLKPDFVLTVADRYETMANAIAATYCNIPLIHVQGGEVSGNIDDRVRHAITKLADLHFPCTEQSRQRLIKMGEAEKVTFNFGCPAIDIALQADKKIDNEIMKNYAGTGEDIDWTKPYILVSQHPVTTSFGDGYQQITETLFALKEFPEYQKIVLWPNIDAGSDHVAKGIRQFREKGQDKGSKFHYYRNFTPEDYVRVLANAICLVGNSSSFIREGAALGLPAVLVGDRQIGREHGKNVMHSSYDRKDISGAIKKQLDHGRYEADDIFGNGTAGKRIVDCIASIELPELKRITY